MRFTKGDLMEWIIFIATLFINALIYREGYKLGRKQVLDESYQKYVEEKSDEVLSSWLMDEASAKYEHYSDLEFREN